MTVKCPCGGRFVRTDIQAIVKNNRTFYQDTDPLKATWRCTHCSNVRTQNKRQKQKGVTS